MDKSLEKSIADAVDTALSASIGDKRYIDLSRIPLICQSIVGIDSRLKGIEGNLAWGIKLVVGAVILGLIALILKA